MKDKITKQDIVRSIKDNYKNLEQSIVSQLLLETPRHHSTTGVYREKIWESLFRQIIPHKFSIAQGVFIIDSSDNTNISKEVDLVVFDEQYTPYIFNYGNIKFIPIEAVAIVIQCKSENITKDKLEDWVKSIDNLNTNSNSIARIATNVAIGPVPTQKATQPIKILCSLKEAIDKSGEPKFGFDVAVCVKKSKKQSKLQVKFSKNIDTLFKAYRTFNLKGESINIEEFEEGINKRIRENSDQCVKGQFQNQLEVAKKLNEIKTDNLKIAKGDEHYSILSLIFQLNQLLMLINNPMLFPHQAYVDMFNKSDAS